MVGLPGSGKTTLAKRLAAEENAMRFTPDEWHIFLFGDDFHREEEHDARHDRVETLMWQTAQTMLRHGVSVILNFGFWAKVQRDGLRREAAKLGVGFQIYYLDTPIEEIKRRLRLRNAENRSDVFQSIRDEDIDAWSKLFEPPDEAELAPS